MDPSFTKMFVPGRLGSLAEEDGRCRGGDDRKNGWVDHMPWKNEGFWSCSRKKTSVFKLKMMVSRGFTIVSHEKFDDCSIKHRDKRVCRFQTGLAENHGQLPVAILLRTPAVCSPTKISDSSLPSLIPLKPSLEAGPSWNSKTIVGWEELPQLCADWNHCPVWCSTLS